MKYLNFRGFWWVLTIEKNQLLRYIYIYIVGLILIVTELSADPNCVFKLSLANLALIVSAAAAYVQTG